MAEKSKNTDKSTNKRLDNLKEPWKKGESGNPNGRPKGQRNYATIYREALIKLAEINGKEADELENEMVQKAIAAARKGDYRFYKDLLDRLYGSATQKVDHTTKGEQINDLSQVEKIAQEVASKLRNANTNG